MPLPWPLTTTPSAATWLPEEEAQKTKKELLILWTDYFKPITWPLSPTCTTPSKQPSFAAPAKTIDQAKAEELMAAVEKIHGMFWQSKGRSDAWVTAS